jgi:isoleucyl-tRNA synthetase
MNLVDALKAHENLVVTETLTVELGLSSSGDDSELHIAVEKVEA